MTDPDPTDDGLVRCVWAAAPGAMRAYHDTEWGVPVAGERAVFERLTLEAFQSGLSWSTILTKRENFRAAFEGFDPEVVAGFDDARFDALMSDAGIVRNRAKIRATIVNARALVALWDAGGSLERLAWGHAPDRQPEPRTPSEVPSRSAESLALSKALKRHGFTFVGPTTMHALMEALGIVNTHVLDCHRRAPTLALREASVAGLGQ